MRKFFIIYNDGAGDKSIFEALMDGIEVCNIYTSEIDGGWTNPGELFGSIEEEGDGLLVRVDDTETWYNWSQIETVGMLYNMYNLCMKEHKPAHSYIAEIADEEEERYSLIEDEI